MDESRSCSDRIEMALRDAERQLSAIGALSSDALFTLDCDGVVTGTFGALERHFGHTAGECIGRPFWATGLIPLESLDAAVKDIHRILSGVRLHEVQYLLAKRDGTKLIGRLSGAPLERDGIITALVSVAPEINLHRYSEETLRMLETTFDQLESRVRERTVELEETNSVLRILVQKAQEEQNQLLAGLRANIHELVLPMVVKVRQSQSDGERQTYLNVLETNLDHVVMPYANRRPAAHTNLTPREIEIVELIKQGKKSQELAELFGVSLGTVLSHRNKIRKKLRLKSRGEDLRTCLLSMT